MSVLVTGGAGFVGTRLSNALVESGYRVRVIDNFDQLAHPDSRPPPLEQDVELVAGDLRDRVAVDRCLEGVERVFHLGGVVGNGESMINVARAVDNNSLGSATLLEAVIARRDRIERVVVASSMVVYGEGTYECPAHGVVDAPVRTNEQLQRQIWNPLCASCEQELRPVAVREDAALRPTSVYGITKRDQEELALVLGRAYGIETVALRYLNIYGAGQALGNPYTGVAAIFAARVLSRQAPLVFEDGNQQRDLIHVSDVVRATIKAMEAIGVAGHAINVATGRRLRVLELARAIVDALGGDQPPRVTGQYRAGDIRHCFADTTRARELLGFEAEVELDNGLPELTDWVAAQPIPSDRAEEAIAGLSSAGLVT